MGASGTGKTTLARRLLAAYDCVLVVDPKCTYGGAGGEDGYTLVRTPRQLRLLNSGHKLIQYRPNEANQDLTSYDEVYKWAYKRGNILVYTDEVYLVMKSTVAPHWLTACITCGRELGIGMINGSQRPVGVDKRIYTESETFVAFRLRNYDDIKLMCQCMGREIEAQPEGHAFWVMKDGWEHPRQFCLNLGGAIGGNDR